MIYMFLNMVMTSWIIGSITLLVVKNDEKNGEYRSNLQLLNEYASMHDFDDGIRKRLKTQLKLDFNNREISDENVLQHFPRTLRRKVIRELYYPALSQTNLMSNVRQMFVDSFLTSCSVEIFGPGEELLQRGSISNDLYLLIDGTVKLTTSAFATSESYDRNGNSIAGGSMADSDSGGRPVKWTLMGGGDFINDIGFFTESPNSHTVLTVTVCKTLTMPKAVYKSIAEDHPVSVSIILQNLLAKAKKEAAATEGSTNTDPPKRLEMVKVMSMFDIRRSASGSEDDPDISKAIEAAQAKASLSTVEDLITMHINKLKDDHTTRFLFAASRSDLPTMRLMLAQGIDPNSADYDRRNALMVASMNGNIEVVSLLLEHHANPNLKDVHGTTALFEAVRNNNPECMEILLQKGADLCLPEDAAATKLCQAVFDGDILFLSRLCQAGIKVDAGDYDRRTAAHIAASEGNLAAIKVLVGAGADINLKDRWNQTIEDEAKSAGATKVLEYLKSLKNAATQDEQN
jgi:CRP-like cAMP-binding protein